MGPLWVPFQYVTTWTMMFSLDEVIGEGKASKSGNGGTRLGQTIRLKAGNRAHNEGEAVRVPRGDSDTKLGHFCGGGHDEVANNSNTAINGSVRT